ncbi:MAG: hypothetical protein CO093_00720 [Alphaproteobacteria bacterium CG_4_9_14_3_um_filter_47_13]|nr:MAG: hypothetical protein CO093_00720 [Alphaproteobacteria bacterium CG_4_9_14_3_um_filter_47_13]
MKKEDLIEKFYLSFWKLFFIIFPVLFILMLWTGLIGTRPGSAISINDLSLDDSFLLFILLPVLISALFCYFLLKLTPISIYKDGICAQNGLYDISCSFVKWEDIEKSGYEKMSFLHFFTISHFYILSGDVTIFVPDFYWLSHSSHFKDVVQQYAGYENYFAVTIRDH